MARRLTLDRLLVVCDGVLEPARAEEAVEALGWLSPWWLRPEVIDAACQEQPVYAAYRRHPALPCQPGGCWALLVNPRRLKLLRDAFVLPLIWREGRCDDPCLPGPLRDLAGQVRRQLGEGFAGWRLSLPLPRDEEAIDLSPLDDGAFGASSAWASLAGGLVLARDGLTSDTTVWASAAWDQAYGIGRVEGLQAKLEHAAERGAKHVFVPAQNQPDVAEWAAERPAGPRVTLLSPAAAPGKPEPRRILEPYFSELVALAKSPARNSLAMFGEPLLHLRDRPLPFRRVGVEPIVLRPRRRDVRPEVFPAAPRPPLQVMQLKGIQQQLRLVEPRGVLRQQPRTPPAAEVMQVARRAVAGMGRVPIVDQIRTPQVAVPAAEVPQRRGVVLSALAFQAHRLHLPAMDDQEHQHRHGAMPLVLELALLDRTGDGAANRHALQDLKVGQLVGTDHPVATAGQVVGVSVAPEDSYSSLHELGVQPCGLPEACAMRSQVNRVQDAADAARADGLGDAVLHGLACQVGAGPMRDVQPPGHRLQAGQLDDLGALEGGEIRSERPERSVWANKPVRPSCS